MTKLGTAQRTKQSVEASHGSETNNRLLELACGFYVEGRISKATGLLEQDYAARPLHRQVRRMLFACYKDGGQIHDMLNMARNFTDNPDNPDELALAWSAWLSVLDFAAAESIQEEVMQAAMQGKLSPDLLPALLLAANGLPELDRQELYALHRVWGKAQPSAIDSNPPGFVAGERIRIAYVSGDFCRHPVSYFMLPVIASHDRERFEVFCYSNTRQPADDMTAALHQSGDHFINITGLSDTELRERMQADGIHIAVDLAGHTANSRTSAFALRLAPVQISWLGYANTTGLDTMDFHISDQHAEDGTAGTVYTEKLLSMPSSFLCYGITWDVDVAEKSPCEHMGQITFASFNNGRKLNRKVIAAWADILQQVDGSRLLLKFSGCAQALLQKNLRHVFAAHGVQGQRIEFLPRSATVGEHIACYHQVDIALDTFPYTGTTTTFEALSQGVPVVTLTGPLHCNRVSSSILKNIGYSETITGSTDDYVQRAVELAGNPQALGVLRGILPLLLRHAACNQPEVFTRDLEALLIHACQLRGMQHA